jgi:Domain of unknown function (DUF6134)
MAGAMVLTTSVPAPACDLPVTQASYRIEHEAFGDIGREVLTVRCEGEQLVVDGTVEVTVRVLLVTAYHREAHYREIWEDGRLIRFESETDDNGTRIAVSARSIGNRVVIEGPDGPKRVPSTVAPSDPWNQRVVDRTLVFDRTGGKVLRVTVTEAGEEPIEVDGQTICARKYIVSGDLERELWYDRAGTWVKSRFYRDGSAITITRQLSSSSVQDRKSARDVP